MPQICFVSRELAPFQRGGIGSFIAAVAPVVADVAEVTLILSEEIEPALGELLAAGDPRVDPRVNYRFAPMPTRAGSDGDGDPAPDVGWSEHALEAIVRAYGKAGPDLIEFCDYRGDAIAAVRARHRDPALLSRTTIAIRAHTSFELVMLLKGTPLPPGAAICGIERQALRAADALTWAGGDVLATYGRYYGAAGLPPAHRIRYPLDTGAPPPPDPRPDPSGALRILYLGRFDRLKGVAELVEGFSRQRSEGWRLTMVGGDTASAPGGGSMLEYVRRLGAGDPRIVTEPHADRARIEAQLAAHDLLVVPSRYEAWGYVALEGLAANRPLIASPVGGLREVVDRRAGWLAEGCGPAAFERALADRLAEPEAVGELIAAGAPRERCLELTDPEPIAAAYLRLAQGRRAEPRRATTAREEGGRGRRPGARAGVSVIVGESSDESLRRAALDSVLGQTREVRNLLVGFDPAEVGAALAESEYVAVLGGDDILHAEFVAATSAALAADEGAAIAYSDRAVFGPRLGEWLAALPSTPAVPSLALPPGEARVIRAEEPGPSALARLDVGLSPFPATALLRCEALEGIGAVPGARWEHAEVFTRLLWSGWGAIRIARALVGCRLVERSRLAELMLSAAILPRLAETERRIAAGREAAPTS